jgi:cephalosporin hydroxylase
VTDPTERLTRRYLELLRAALLDEHHLENELRLRHVLECLAAGTEVDIRKLADPGRFMAQDLRLLRRVRRTGELAAKPPGQERGMPDLAYTGLGQTRLDHLEACVTAIGGEAIPGDLVDCGAGRGGAAIYMRALLEVLELSERRVWVADRFDDVGQAASGVPPATSSLNAVREAFDRFSLLDDRVRFIRGELSRALGDAPIDEIALLRVDGRDPEQIEVALAALHKRVAPGGFVVVDHYGSTEGRAAVDRFLQGRTGVARIEQIDWGAAGWRIAGSPDRERPHGGTVAQGTVAKDLSVVVVVHDMRREAHRTLHSLSRSYQQGIGDVEYEVVVVENGSTPDQRLGEEFVRGHGAEFRYIDLGAEARRSPAHAVNRGIADSTGRAVCLMIDGAHVVTPGVLRYGLLGLSTYAPAVVTARQWYVGPGQQPRAVAGGYDEAFEDRLFKRIGWPADGYRLFEIGHFIGDRDWFDGEWESNCIFVPRALIEQVGGMDESFSTPGGGFVNLDFFERVVGSPGVTQVTMLGEGSFHQIHGGTTTNLGEFDRREDLIRSYEANYETLRGRPFQVPEQHTHFVGSLPPPARRTRPRRMSAQQFRPAHLEDADGRPSRPAPVPDDLRSEFIDAYWRSGSWHLTPWLGQATHRAPADLLAYQELVFRIRPDWIVETRTGPGGKALFLASICDLVGGGQVLSIDGPALAEPPEHSRVTYMRGAPEAPDTAERVRKVVGDQPRVIVILGAAAAPQLKASFRNYAPLVPVGSYVVVEDTILGGRPVWPGFGPGPASVAQELAESNEFRPDPLLERGVVTFNPSGFLKRIR